VLPPELTDDVIAVRVDKGVQNLALRSCAREFLAVERPGSRHIDTLIPPRKVSPHQDRQDMP
jgi:hypothetical protein